MSKSQKGFSPILIVVLIAALAAGFFFFKSGSLPTGGVKTLQVATEADFANIEDPVLRKHFAAQANVASVRTRTKSSGKGEIIDVMEYEMSRTDFKMRQVQEKGGKEVAHLISIEDTTYVKDFSDNAWWKETVKFESEEEEVPETQEEVKEGFLMEDPSSYKSLGQEACGNLTCYKYEQTIKDAFGAKRTFWFDTKMHLLRKEVVTFGEFSTETEYSYDNINIKTPSPTKDVPEGKSAYDYYFPVEEGVPSSPVEVPVTPDYGDYNPEDYALPEDFYSEE